MGTRERYEHGVFSYVELATRDAAAAKDFYGTLFGWTFEDVPLPGDMTYSPAHKDGKRVAALYQSERPTPWLSYVTVDDLDAAAAQVPELGGTIVQEPMDVSDLGRMAIAQDPAGAVFALWEAKRNIGAELVNAPGALSWNDLQSTDVDASVAFYTELLGWETGDVEGAPDERKVIRVGEGLNGGIAKLADGAREAGAPSHWLALFAVEDVDASCETVKAAGGAVLVEPFDIPAGRWAIVADPEGVSFGIFTGELDD